MNKAGELQRESSGHNDVAKNMPRALRNFELADHGQMPITAAQMGLAPAGQRPLLRWLPSYQRHTDAAGTEGRPRAAAGRVGFPKIESAVRVRS